MSTAMTTTTIMRANINNRQLRRRQRIVGPRRRTGSEVVVEGRRVVG